MLDPSNTEFLGYQVDHLEAEQPTRFLDSLAQRLNKPVTNHPRPVARARTRPSAPPARQITAATTRPRDTQTRLSFSPDKSEIEIVDDIIPLAGPSTSSRRMSPPLSARRPARAASTAASARVTNIYSQSAEVDQVFAAAALNRSRGRDSASIQSIDDDESMDFDDSFLQQIDAVEARAGRPTNNFVNDDDDEDQYDFDDDESFIRQIDEVEKAATRGSAVEERKTSRFFDTPVNPSGSRNGASKRIPVYVVDSDGDSGKENCEPDIVYISD
jgi:RecQ-mediated genome instability protein 1